jgi:predicted aldo/keto reductase-like oxidoreductase
MLWSRMRDFKVLHWADKMLAKGKISYLGFSFHDETALLKEIINYYNNWTFCQIQYNYMDEKFQAGTKGLQYAAGKGLAVVIMEPIRGGQLSRPPESIKNLLNTGRRKSSPAEWALRWVWNHPEVSVVLSGMSNMQQVVENVESATKFGSDALSQSEINRIKRARDSYKKLVPIPCTGCEYCMPCDNGVAIPQIFALYNEGVMYNDKKTQQAHYREGPMAIKDSQRPDNCKECKKCEEACPQKIPITEWLKKAKDYLEA